MPQEIALSVNGRVHRVTVEPDTPLLYVLRNDLGRLHHLKTPGGVTVQSLFDIETFETLHQMTSTIHGNLAPDAMTISVAEMIRALFPCGSVTGAPKIRTMEIIHELDSLDPSDASLDPDGDGLSNLTEYQRNSDPNVYTGSSPLQLLIVLMMTTAGFIFSGVLFVRVRRRRNNSEETRAEK